MTEGTAATEELPVRRGPCCRRCGCRDLRDVTRTPVLKTKVLVKGTCRNCGWRVVSCEARGKD